MGAILLTCPNCGCTDLAKNGKHPTGKQRYLCYNQECHQPSFTLEPSVNRGSHPEVREEVIRMASNGAGMRDIARTLQISRTTVTKLIKKKRSYSSSEILTIKLR
jgi:transposase-like protein